MHKRMAANGLALLGLLASTTVLAETQPGFYVGAGVGSATVEFDDVGFGIDFDADDTAFKVFGGYNFNRYFAIEAAYFDAGKADQDIFDLGNIEVGIDGLNVSAVGRAPIGDAFSVFAKLGYASYDFEVNGRYDGELVASQSGSDEDVSYGVGAAFNFGAFELRGEYEAITIEDGDFTILSLSGLYRF